MTVGAQCQSPAITVPKSCAEGLDVDALFHGVRGEIMTEIMVAEMGQLVSFAGLGQSFSGIIMQEQIVVVTSVFLS
jgi:hypothetical protein